MLRLQSNCLAGVLIFTILSATSSAQSDTTPPKLISFNISPTTVNVSQGPVTLSVRITISDDLSGFRTGSIDIRSTSGANPFGRGSLPITGGTELNAISEFTLTVPQFSLEGTYPITLMLYDKVYNTLIVSSADLKARGFPSAITVINSLSPQGYTTIATIPHLASGDGWQTTVRASGVCTAGCVLDISTFDVNGTLLNKVTESLPVSASRWAKSLVLADSPHLMTGWIEVKATSQQSVGLCASALFTNSVSRQEASSSSDCVQESGWESGAVGSVQYFYSHLSGYVSGVALLNRADVPLTARLEWRDESDSVVASRVVPLGPRQQTSFTSNEAVGKFGRFLVIPDPSMSQAQKDLFSTSIYSLGFQFSPFGSFTQLSNIE